MALIAAFGLAVAGCKDTVEPSGIVEIEWGPLAVSRGRLGSELATSGGTLRVTSECAVLDKPGSESLLLLWWQGNTEWDAKRQVIRHRAGDGSIKEFRSGDEVVVGGGGGEVTDWSEWQSTFDWASVPKEACKSAGVWSVGTIDKR